MPNQLIAQQITDIQSLRDFKKLRVHIHNSPIRRARRAGLDHMPIDDFVAHVMTFPHWREIGQGRGKYHICRWDHRLGYTRENTFIGKAEENGRERIARCGNPVQHRSGLLIGYTDEEKRQRKRDLNRTWHSLNDWRSRAKRGSRHCKTRNQTQFDF